jgi:hypothetical protein
MIAAYCDRKLSLSFVRFQFAPLHLVSWRDPVNYQPHFSDSEVGQLYLHSATH